MDKHQSAKAKPKNSGSDHSTNAARNQHRPQWKGRSSAGNAESKLLPGRPEDVQPWMDSISEHIEQVFSVHRDIVTSLAYEEEPPEIAPPNGNAGQATLEIFKLRYQYRHKKVIELQESKRKIFAYIWSRLSDESKDRVMMSGVVCDPINRDDPLALLKAIRSSHMIQSFSGVDQHDKRSARLFYASVKQLPRESVTDFKNRFMAALTGMRIVGATIPTEAEQVQDFISSLDHRRYGQLISDLANRLIPFPASIDAAKRLAETRYEVTCTNVSGTEHSGKSQAAFLTNSKQEKKKTSKQRRYPCSLCESFEHGTHQCPLLSKAKQAIQPDDKQKQVHILTSNRRSFGSSDADDDGDEYGFLVKRKSPFGAEHLLLDNQASASIVYNKDLLSNCRRTTPTVFSGYGGCRTLSIIGELPFLGTAFYDPDAPANLVSMAAVEKSYHITYRQGRSFTVHVSPSLDLQFFKNTKGHYICDFRPYLARANNVVAVVTYTEQEARYTKKEVEKAREARTYLRNLGYPSVRDAISSLAYVRNASITANDIYRALDIYGTDPAIAKGKAKEKKAITCPSRREAIPADMIQREQVLFADIATIEGHMFLVTVSNPLGLIVASCLKSKSSDTIVTEIGKIVSQYTSRGFQVKRIHTDPESVFVGAEDSIRAMGINMDISGVNKHVPDAEVRIRIIKERCRCILNSLPYALPRSLIPNLVLYVVARINSLPSNLRVDKTPPRQVFTNRIMDVERDLKFGFGDYCIIEDFPEIKNSMAPRAVEAIALNPSINLSGSIAFFDLSSKRIVLRDKWQVIPMPQSAIDLINKISVEQDGKRKKTYRSSAVISGDSIPTPTYINRATIPTDTATYADENEANDPAVVRVEDIGNNSTLINESEGDDVENEHVSNDESDNNGMLKDTSEQSGEDNLSYEMDGEVDHQVQVVQCARPPPHPPPSHAFTGVHVFNVSFGKAIKKFGKQPATAAVEAELRQMDAKDVWSPVPLSEVRNAKTIRSFIFLKEKVDANGNFQKLKARLVAGGNDQEVELYPDKSSPTASAQTIFMLAAIAGNENRTVVTADIGSAYLNASMRDANIFMRLDPTVTNVLVNLFPEKYRGFANANGTVVVRLKKALYGCIESAKLWYETLRDALSQFGFSINIFDYCVFNKVENGIQLTVAVYVDDLFISCVDPKMIESFLTFLENRFGAVTINRGLLHSYLGMSFDFRESGSVRITMEGFTAELLKLFPVQGIASTPASNSLFVVSNEPNVVLLDEREKKIFHSVVAKLLYLAKRSRPDILTSVSFLATRVTAPDVVDQRKLVRVMRYLNGTQQLGVKLEVDSDNILGYIDASYAVHPDFRSHSGVCISLGKGPIFVGSSKQKINTKSSTEAEIVALSDKLGEVIWVRNFLQHQTSGSRFNAPAIIYQDNTSAMALIDRGKTMNSATKHINIRFFFVKDRVLSGDVVIRYLSTQQMIADILTKPLQGKAFHDLRASLLNDGRDICTSESTKK